MAFGDQILTDDYHRGMTCVGNKIHIILKEIKEIRTQLFKKNILKNTVFFSRKCCT